MRIAPILLFLFTVLTSVADAAPPQEVLGKLSFPTSGPPAAQAHFERGVLFLHSFFYDEALDAFRAATAAAPDFAMGYWGEAMTYDHPIWEQHDGGAGRAALARIPASARLTPRERDFVAAARLLFTPGARAPAKMAYAAALERMHAAYPDDDEVTAFYALSLLGLAGEEASKIDLRIRAGALMLGVFGKNPEHPGAAHYTIHAFDDPLHAVLALPAARRYAEIAPAAFHARHMPSHIFVHLGLWPEALRANESAWAASQAWIERRHQGIEKRDFHSLSWLTSIALQLGDRRRADETLQIAADTLAKVNAHYTRGMYATIAAAILTETGEWRRAEELLRPLARSLPPPRVVAQTGDAGADCHLKNPGAMPFVLRIEALEGYLRGLGAVAVGDWTAAQLLAEHLAELRRTLGASTHPDARATAEAIEVQENHLTATLLAQKGDLDGALQRLERSRAIEQKILPSGPAFTSPASEVMGELLLAAGRQESAAAAFTAALQRHPGRMRSKMGLERATMDKDKNQGKTGKAAKAAPASPAAGSTP